MLNSDLTQIADMFLMDIKLSYDAAGQPEATGAIAVKLKDLGLILPFSISSLYHDAVTDTTALMIQGPGELGLLVYGCVSEYTLHVLNRKELLKDYPDDLPYQDTFIAGNHDYVEQSFDLTLTNNKGWIEC